MPSLSANQVCKFDSLHQPKYVNSTLYSVYKSLNSNEITSKDDKNSMKRWRHLLILLLVPYLSFADYKISEKDQFQADDLDGFIEKISEIYAQAAEEEVNLFQPPVKFKLQEFERYDTYPQDELCVECDNALNLSKSVSKIVDEIIAKKESSEIVKNEQQELKAMIEIVNEVNLKAELLDARCNFKTGIKFEKLKKTESVDFESLNLIASSSFPLEDIDGLTFSNLRSNIVLLKGTDTDNIVVVDIDKNTKEATVYYYKMANIKERPEETDGERELGLSLKIKDKETDRDQLKVGPMITISGKTPKKFTVLETNFESKKKSKIVGEISTKEQEIKYESGSKLLDAVIKPTGDIATLTKSFKATDLTSKIIYNDEEDTSITIEKKGKLLIEVESKAKDDGDITVSIPTTFDILMSNYSVDGATSISSTKFSGSYALKRDSNELFVYKHTKADHGHVEHSVSKSKQLSNDGVISVKFTDVKSNTAVTGIEDQSAVWLSFSIKK